jgi:methylmalonyl-CoA decarboxylase
MNHLRTLTENSEQTARHPGPDRPFASAPVISMRESRRNRTAVEPDDLEAVIYELARPIAVNSPLSIRVIKEQLRILGNAHPLSPETFERIQGLRRSSISHDYREGTSAILERRAPVFTGD